MISKYILPWFGGTSAVWITAMLFFQTALLLGYFYVFLISRLAIKIQFAIQMLLVFCIGFNLLLPVLHTRPAILPDINSFQLNTGSPIALVLEILFVTIGTPYLLLSTTSIVLQKWYGILYRQKSPYLFYALSNTASLLAVISYPFVFEPNYTLNAQAILWTCIFLCYCMVLLIGCISASILFYPASKKEKSPAAVYPDKISLRSILPWICFPALSSLLLLSITNLLTQSVASVPFLWLLPLCLYLLSFILTFSGKRWYLRNLYAYLFLATAFLSLVFTITDIPSLATGILVYSLTLFCACMLCHGEVYGKRPPAGQLDTYYLCLAFGSAISSVFVGVIAPLFFHGIWEIYIAFYLMFLLAISVLLQDDYSFVSRHAHRFFTTQKEIYAAAIVLFPVCIFAVGLVLNSGSNYTSVTVWRSFYGVLTVNKKVIGNITGTYIKHGNIIHGAQLSGVYRKIPTTYYSQKSGIGLIIQSLRKYKKNINVGVIGLGAGTLAAYGQKNDTFTFYELNPQIIQISRNEFTYLKDTPAKIVIVQGDGRLSMEKEIGQKNLNKYDILIVDAFSDDAIPPHLLTTEALSLYLKRLVYPSGILAFHISNNFIDLKPVLVSAAHYFKLSYAVIHTPTSGVGTEAEWMFLSYNSKLFQEPLIAKAKFPDSRQYNHVNLWTDQYSNLFQVLK